MCVLYNHTSDYRLFVFSVDLVKNIGFVISLTSISIEVKVIFCGSNGYIYILNEDNTVIKKMENMIISSQLYQHQVQV